MNEKQAVERGTARGFLILFNQRFGTDFRIAATEDHPDVRCVDSHGATLNLEITATEDQPGDIKAALGRSDSRSIEALQAHNERVAQGKAAPKVSSLSDEVTDELVKRIEKKLNHDYGPDTALVIRDTSGVDWDWDSEIPAIRNRLDLGKNPFARGIWLLSRTRQRLFQIV